MTTLHPHPDGAERPYAAAAVHQGVIYACGQLPRAEDGSTPEDMADQVELALDNLQRVLEPAGGGLHSLLKMTVFLADLDEFDAYNDAYLKRFAGLRLPPRTTVEVARFRGRTRIEIDAIAAVADR
ncbi:RidA family protein [Saccharopolyspora sp. 5N102]|uniref:RidA family protein n=1 Tax=Saccharopolyspora sp. 5N102 TaxID=3375155 RepID=UPI00379C887D